MSLLLLDSAALLFLFYDTTICSIFSVAQYSLKSVDVNNAVPLSAIIRVGLPNVFVVVDFVGYKETNLENSSTIIKICYYMISIEFAKRWFYSEECKNLV